MKTSTRVRAHVNGAPNMNKPPIFKTLSHREFLNFIDLAIKVKNRATLPSEKTGAKYLYQDGVLLVDQLLADPMVVVFSPEGATSHTFETILGSGTDKLRQRIRADLYFESKVSQVSIPYYLTVEEVPKDLKLTDLPIRIATFEIAQNSKPFVDRSNKISGHEWREPTGLARHCSIRGIGAGLSSRFGTVKGALEQVDFLLKHPHIVPRTDRELAYIAASDASINASEQRRARPSM